MLFAPKYGVDYTAQYRASVKEDKTGIKAFETVYTCNHCGASVRSSTMIAVHIRENHIVPFRDMPEWHVTGMIQREYCKYSGGSFMPYDDIMQHVILFGLFTSAKIGYYPYAKHMKMHNDGYLLLDNATNQFKSARICYTNERTIPSHFQEVTRLNTPPDQVRMYEYILAYFEEYGAYTSEDIIMSMNSALEIVRNSDMYNIDTAFRDSISKGVMSHIAPHIIGNTFPIPKGMRKYET